MALQATKFVSNKNPRNSEQASNFRDQQLNGLSAPVRHWTLLNYPITSFSKSAHERVSTVGEENEHKFTLGGSLHARCNEVNASRAEQVKVRIMGS